MIVNVDGEDWEGKAEKWTSKAGTDSSCGMVLNVP